MRYGIVFAPDTVRDLRQLRATLRSTVQDAIEMHLRHDPTRVRKSRIKRLLGLARPQFRLRVGEIRVYYDVVGQEVQVLAIVPKSQAEAWLEQAGEPE